MAIQGRKPKPEGQAVNRSKPAHDWIEVENVPFTGRAPALPKDVIWSAASKKRWAVIRRMPHASIWGPGDWEYAVDYLRVFEAHHHDPTAELRLRGNELGLSAGALRDLRIRYIDPKPRAVETDAVVTQIDEFRDL